MNHKAQIFGYFLISSILILFFIIITISISEVTGLSKKFSENLRSSIHFNNGSTLIKIDYYGEEQTIDPYLIYQEKFIHPYYIFSLPWKNNNYKKNNVVNLDKFGFRVNPTKKKDGNNALILGGSTAFGHFSSSDKNTLASIIGKITGYNIVNRNAPSWNSFQELIALSKFKENYNHSISVSLANDISIACEANTLWNEGYIYIDAPESFNHLYTSVHKNKSDISEIVKLFIEYLFNDTVELYRAYRAYNVVKNDSEKTKYNETPKKSIDYCNSLTAKQIVNNFLFNQNLMHGISTQRKAKHVLTLQPQVFYFAKNKKYQFVREVYEGVMNSKYCSLNLCLNLNQFMPKNNSFYDLLFPYFLPFLPIHLYTYLPTQ